MIDRNVGRHLILLMLVCAGLQFPYLEQAFHIDDNIVLMVSRNLRVHPWFPQDLHSFFEGLKVESFISHEHPLLLSSILLSPAASGDSKRPELTAHGIYLIFYLLIVTSTFVLARRVTTHAWTAALLAGASPVIFVSSHTVMSDLPYVALVYVALALAVWSRGSTLGSILTGLSCAGAVMFAYQSLAFVPVVYRAQRVDTRGRMWIWFVPLAALLIYVAVNSYHFGRLIWWDLLAFWYQQPPSGGGFWGKMTHSLLAFVGSIVFPLGWVALFGKIPRKPEDPVVFETAKLLATIIGVNILLIIFVYHVGAVRYWLPSAPAVCILTVWRISERMPHKWKALALAVLVLWSTMLSIMLANADYEWADFYRRSARLVSDYQRSEAVQVWIAGEWGFRWYFTQQGGDLMGRADNRAQPGDVLIRPKIASPYLTLYDTEPGTLELERRIQYRPSTPLRLLDFHSHAGFYSSGWGLLPYSVNLSSEALEEIFVYRIRKAMPRPNREPTYWEWNR